MRVVFFTALAVFASFNLSYAQDDESEQYFAGEMYDHTAAEKDLAKSNGHDSSNTDLMSSEELATIARNHADQMVASLEFLKSNKVINDQLFQKHYLNVARSFFYLSFYESSPNLPDPLLMKLIFGSIKSGYYVSYTGGLYLAISTQNGAWLGLCALGGCFHFLHNIAQGSKYNSKLYNEYFKVFWNYLRTKYGWSVPRRSIKAKLSFLKSKIESATGKPLNKCEIAFLNAGLL